MICPRCSGEWTVKRIGFLGLTGKKRQVCSQCGYKDERDCWVDDVYIGPKDHDPNLDDPEKLRTVQESKQFYTTGKMPCCGADEYYKGPQGGLSTNIKCAGCGATFNMTPMVRLLERI